MDEQMVMFDDNPEYQAFVDKFKRNARRRGNSRRASLKSLNGLV